MNFILLKQTTPSADSVVVMQRLADWHRQDQAEHIHRKEQRQLRALEKEKAKREEARKGKGVSPTDKSVPTVMQLSETEAKALHLAKVTRAETKHFVGGGIGNWIRYNPVEVNRYPPNTYFGCDATYCRDALQAGTGLVKVNAANIASGEVKS